MARHRRSGDYRDVDGLLLLDKAAGISSNRALQQVRALYNARKAGHCGSLDPLATGLLPICLGEATKYAAYLLGADKAYHATCRLGQTTSTGDAEGEITARREVEVDRARLLQVLRSFEGEIDQVPPMHSALKRQGKRLYELAREGREVAREARRIRIRSIEAVELDGTRLVFDVTCSKGTYVRTLAEDIGRALGCGAHLEALRRTRVEPFDLDQASDFERLQQFAADGPDAIDALLLPVGSVLGHISQQVLTAAEGRDICQGRNVNLDSASVPGLRRLVLEDGRFIGLGEVVENGVLRAKRLINTAR